MTIMQEHKMNIVKDIIKGRITKRMSSEQLFLGIRQINRLIQKFKQEGSSAFIHKNTGRISPREIDKDIRDTILKLRVEQYEDYNIQHFQEKLVEKHNKTDLCINELEDALKVLFGKISNVKAIIICKNIK
jgi:hypothetical protein